MTINGTIKYIDLEGGFWAIIAEDGKGYFPLEGIPKDFQTEGMNIRAQVNKTDAITFANWGIPIEIVKLDKLS